MTPAEFLQYEDANSFECQCRRYCSPRCEADYRRVHRGAEDDRNADSYCAKQDSHRVALWNSIALPAGSAAFIGTRSPACTSCSRVTSDAYRR